MKTRLILSPTVLLLSAIPLVIKGLRPIYPDEAKSEKDYVSYTTRRASDNTVEEPLNNCIHHNVEASGRKLIATIRKPISTYHRRILYRKTGRKLGPKPRAKIPVTSRRTTCRGPKTRNANFASTSARQELPFFDDDQLAAAEVLYSLSRSTEKYKSPPLIGARCRSSRLSKARLHRHSTPSAHRDHEEEIMSTSDNEEQLVKQQVDEHKAPRDTAGIHITKHGVRTRQPEVAPSHPPAAEEKVESFSNNPSQSPQHSRGSTTVPSDCFLHTTNVQRVDTQPVHSSLSPLRAAENDAITPGPVFLTANDQENDYKSHYLSPTNHIPTDATPALNLLGSPGTVKATTRVPLSLFPSHEVGTDMVDNDMSLSGPHGREADPVRTDLSLSGPHGREADPVRTDLSLSGPHGREADPVRTDLSLSGPHGRGANPAPIDLSLSIEPTRAVKTASYLSPVRVTKMPVFSSFPQAVYTSTVPHSVNHHYAGPQNPASGILPWQGVQQTINQEMLDPASYGSLVRRSGNGNKDMPIIHIDRL